MNVCTICKHQECDEIDRAIARGVSFRVIANQFQVGNNSIQRHQKCISEALTAARKEQNYRTARNVDEELEKTFQFVEKVMGACDKWLTDPDNPDEYTLDARAGDIEVVYREVTGNDENGQPTYKSKRAKLSELLARVEGGGLLIQSVESSHSDPRKLMLDAIGKMHGSIDQLAKLTGAYQKKQENRLDKKRNRIVMVIAIQLASEAEGNYRTREQIDRDVDKSIRDVERVWKEAERIAIAEGLIT